MPCCTVHTNEPHQAQRVVKLQRSHPRVSSFGGEISASNRCRHPCQRPSRCGGERLLMCTCLYMLCHNLCVCVLRSIVFFFTMQAVKDQQRDQRNCGNSARHSSSMGQHAICSTTTSIVRRPVRLHAASVKLACRKSAFNRSSSGLHFTCPAARAASHRKKTVMGLPIPIIGPLFNPFFAAIAYALGAARFWSNYEKTSFDGAQKTKLTALWPILAIGSKNFRDELKKTLN